MSDFTSGRALGWMAEFNPPFFGGVALALGVLGTAILRVGFLCGGGESVVSGRTPLALAGETPLEAVATGEGSVTRMPPPHGGNNACSIRAEGGVIDLCLMAHGGVGNLSTGGIP